jgi:hypothetical protein
VLKQLVGAPGFEPGASCAQDRPTISCKFRIFNHSIENTSLRCVQEMWLDVGECIGLIVGSLQKSLQFLIQK